MGYGAHVGGLWRPAALPAVTPRSHYTNDPARRYRGPAFVRLLIAMGVAALGFGRTRESPALFGESFLAARRQLRFDALRRLSKCWRFTA